jgi:hypothetical protein
LGLLPGQKLRHRVDFLEAEHAQIQLFSQASLGLAGVYGDQRFLSAARTKGAGGIAHGADE